MIWPEALVKELASRRCIIFLGAGASAGSLSADGNRRPPNWLQLLEGLIEKMNDRTDEELIRDLMAKEKFLDAAEIIVDNVSPANYTDYLRSTLQLPRFQPSATHEPVFNIDPKVVITTNYDDIYDNYCRQGASAYGYNICRHNDNHLVSDLRSPYRIIAKAHGCISSPSDTILTKSQFFEAKLKYPGFYKILDSLFLTSTILFIGYSVNDPDIQLILENANISAIGSHPHYACLPNDIHPTIREAIARTYNIEIIEFEAGNYTELETGLADLASEVATFRLSNPQ